MTLLSLGDAKMSLKKVLLEKVPLNSQEDPHFHALLDHIKHHKIETKEHLRDSLNQDIDVVGTWLKDNKNSGVTKVKSIRNKVLQLDVLKKCSKLTGEFLF